MSQTQEAWIQRVGRGGILARGLTLFGCFMVYMAMATPVAFWLYGTDGLWAAGLATLLCLFSCWLAMVATALLIPPTTPTAHVLVGMLIRMSLPLFACLIITQQSQWLTEAGLAGFLVVAFCLGLTLETLWSVGQLKSKDSGAQPLDRRDEGDGITLDVSRGVGSRGVDAPAFRGTNDPKRTAFRTL